MRYEGFADVNYREPRGNPRRGGRYASSTQRFDDLDDRNATRSSASKPMCSSTFPLLSDRRVTCASRAGVDVRRGRRARSAVLLPADARRTGRSPRLSPLPFPRQARAAAAGRVPVGDLHGRGRRDLLRRRQGGVAPRGSEAARSGVGLRHRIPFRHAATAYSCASRGRSAAASGKHFIFRFGHVF